MYYAIFLGFLLSTVCNLSFGYELPTDIEIHPSMKQAIEQNEQRLAKKQKLSNFLIIKGKRYPTGFNPTAEFYSKVKVIKVKADFELIERMKAQGGLDYRKVSYSPVRGQIWGSCWAEGAGSVHELNYNRKYGTKEIFAVQDYIDCSGYGTARNGGQIAVEYGAKAGIAKEADYPYNGKDNRCRNDVTRYAPFTEVAIIRGENGGFPTEPEALTAFFLYGAMEVCGSASSLRGGGRVDNPGTGSTNHCYAWASAKPGKDLGWLDAWYYGEKNSWGAKSSPANLNLSRGDWGDEGWGDYRLSKDGQSLKGQSVMTELMIANFGDFDPPGPIEFQLKSEMNKSNTKVKVNPGKYKADKIKKAALKMGYEVE